MGHRFPWCCGVGAVLAWSAGVHAEDIGHEPLAPRDGAEALSLRGPSSAARGGESAGAGGGALSPRGPSASAEHPAIDAGAEYKPRRKWYGWQTLIVDGATSIALVAVASRNSSDKPEGWLTGVAVTYAVAPPIIHLAHGHAGKAALSLAIRAAGPLLIAGAVSNDSAGLGILGVLSIPAAVAIDAAAIAREDVTTETSFLQRVGFAPWVDPRRGAGGLLLDLRL
jgi:hypothetical protein